MVFVPSHLATIHLRDFKSLKYMELIRDSKCLIDDRFVLPRNVRIPFAALKSLTLLFIVPYTSDILSLLSTIHFK
jgi:hypothetical protein